MNAIPPAARRCLRSTSSSPLGLLPASPPRGAPPGGEQSPVHSPRRVA